MPLGAAAAQGNWQASSTRAGSPGKVPRGRARGCCWGGGVSLAGSLGSNTSRSCLSLSTGATELVVAGDVVDTPASSPARQRAGSGVASKEGTAMPEAFGDKALEM